MTFCGQGDSEYIGQSEGFRRILETVNVISSHECAVMILGESGTGKEMVARRIHRHSRRAAGPFIPVDCTNLSGELFSSQLFGHVKGAFTGADRETLGFFRAANMGTIFLDEIGELPLNVQGKFLRVLQESRITPVGSNTEYPVDVRVICATNRNIEHMIREGNFRQDLYYRLKVIEIWLPPLRDRREDILPLAEYFLKKHALRRQEPVKALSTEAIKALTTYAWPGNVRELGNVIEHACVFANHHSLKCSDLPEAFRTAVKQKQFAGNGQLIPLDEAKKNLIIEALRLSEGNQTLAARMLRIDRRRLYRMVHRYGLQSLVGK